MRYRFRGQCADCGHEWDGLWRRIACGRIDFHDESTYRRYVCTRCEVELDVARFASRSGWLRWVSQNASELTQSPLCFTASELGVRVDLQSLDVIARSPLLFLACEKVSSILAGTTSRYLPVVIDIGDLVCPGCSEAMMVPRGHADFLVCPRCESPSAVSVSEEHAGTILVDYRSLEADDVRDVIRHLEGLAEPIEFAGAKRMMALPAVECGEPLWDRQLDG